MYKNQECKTILDNLITKNDGVVVLVLVRNEVINIISSVMDYLTIAWSAATALVFVDISKTTIIAGAVSASSFVLTGVL